MDIIIFILLIILAICGYTLFRNNQVFNYRIKVLNYFFEDNHLEAHDSLKGDYTNMMLKFWIPLEDKYWLPEEHWRKPKE